MFIIYQRHIEKKLPTVLINNAKQECPAKTYATSCVISFQGPSIITFQTGLLYKGQLALFARE
ncbi:MAG: hypothetical protein EA409_09655 [Saprospirales bacterium]|nr:MAG: hypothetical protein EA409_09655 [Saprospirales bacterium]